MSSSLDTPRLAGVQARGTECGPGEGPSQLCGLPEVLASSPAFLPLRGRPDAPGSVSPDRLVGLRSDLLVVPSEPTGGPGLKRVSPRAWHLERLVGRLCLPHPHFCRPVGLLGPGRGVQQERGEEEGGRVEFGVPSLGLAWRPGEPPPGSCFWVWLGADVSAAIPMATAPHGCLEEARRSSGLFSLQKTLRDFLERAIRESCRPGTLGGSQPSPARVLPARNPGSQGAKDAGGQPTQTRRRPGARSLFLL